MYIVADGAGNDHWPTIEKMVSSLNEGAVGHYFNQIFLC